MGSSVATSLALWSGQPLRINLEYMGGTLASSRKQVRSWILRNKHNITWENTCTSRILSWVTKGLRKWSALQLLYRSCISFGLGSKSDVVTSQLEIVFSLSISHLALDVRPSSVLVSPFIPKPTSMSGLDRHPATHRLVGVFIREAREANVTGNWCPVIGHIVMAASEPWLIVSTILNHCVLAIHLSVDTRPYTTSLVSSCLRLCSYIVPSQYHWFSQSRYLGVN